MVGVDLRNELRGVPGGAKATWGGADPSLDWRAAAKRGGDAVLAENSKLLVAVEGLRVVPPGPRDLRRAEDRSREQVGIPARRRKALYRAGALGTEDTFGFLDVTWTKPASPDLAAALAAITPIKQRSLIAMVAAPPEARRASA